MYLDYGEVRIGEGISPPCLGAHRSYNVDACNLARCQALIFPSCREKALKAGGRKAELAGPTRICKSCHETKLLTEDTFELCIGAAGSYYKRRCRECELERRREQKRRLRATAREGAS